MTDVLEEPSSKRQRLVPPSDFDDDPLSELERLDPLPNAMQQQSSSNVEMNMGPGPSPVSSVGANQIAPYLVTASNLQAQPSGPVQTSHSSTPSQNAASQPSVLQELLLNPSNQSNQTLNSPRAPYTNQYQTRSPMTSAASIMTPVSCPPGTAHQSGSRGMRAAGPQMYSTGAHSDMNMQGIGAPSQLGLPGQQGSYVPSQMMNAHPQQSSQSLNYGYQQQTGSRAVYAGGANSRAVYAGNVRAASGPPPPQAMAVGRNGGGAGAGGSVLLNGGSTSHAPRMRNAPQGIHSMQQQQQQQQQQQTQGIGVAGASNGAVVTAATVAPGAGAAGPTVVNAVTTGAGTASGQLMRTIMVQQAGGHYDQSAYGIASAGPGMQRATDSYSMQVAAAQQGQPNYGQMSTGHMIARNQAMQFGNPQAVQTQMQQQPSGSLMPPHMLDQQAQQSGMAIGHPNVMTPIGSAGPTGQMVSNTKLTSQMPSSVLPSTSHMQQFGGINSAAQQRDSPNMNHSLSVGAQGGSQDPEKRKLIQQQLVLLLHAHKCQQRERTGDGTNGRSVCTLPHCSTMKDVLQHMTTCSSGRTCVYAHCASSRQIISHWKNCVREDCPVCKPLKTIQNTPQSSERRATGVDVFSNSNASNAQQIQCPSNTTNIDIPNRIPSQPSLTTNSSNSTALNNYDSPGPSTNSLIIDYNPANDPFRSPNPPNKVVPSFGKGSGMMTAPKDTMGLPPPDTPTVVKSWQEEVTKDLRNHLVGKLVKAIFPSPDPAAMHDQRIKDLITYARKVEREIFEVANDREEYYHLLAEKIYKIQKELHEKKIKRLHEQRTGIMNSVPASQIGVDFDMPGPPNRTTPSFQTNSTANSLTNGPSAAAENAKPGSSSSVKVDKGTKTASSTTRNAAVKVSKPETKEIKVEDKKELPDNIVDPSEMRINLKPIVEKLLSMEESIPFRIPVDPDILGIPDYFDIVKKPMDLSTITERLEKGLYKNPWEFCDDMCLMFENAWLYNRKNSKVYKFCNKLNEVFVEEINPIMQKMGYCCGQKLSFTPLALFCYGQSMCTIARDQTYHVYEATSTQYGVTVSDRYTYCTKCFDALPETGISLSENPNDTSNMVPKSKFQIMKNDQIDFEPFEQCIKCYRKWHRVCALYNKKVYPEGFVCDTCRRELSLLRPENRFTARRLPHCALSRFIEERVNKFMQNNPAGKDYEVIIRVLCAADKEVEVKPLMKQKYGPLGFPDKFPYRTKAVFAFEVIDGVEVCFFGLHVQEYGSNCPDPNNRRVYIAYLDSVHFFQPRQLRTDVYHEILLGYLQYAMLLGYTMAHIWACPPSEGDDYIFHCHPPEQKIPKPKRLQDWYKKMLDKGVTEHTVFDYKDIHKQARDDNLTTPMGLSYFEGDFWPNVIEDCIREAQNEEQERKRQEEAQQNAEDEDEDDVFHTGDNMKSKKNSKKKNNLKKGNLKNKKKICSQTGNEVTDKLYANFEKHKEVFFTIRLMSPQSELTAHNKEIADPDPLFASDLMDGRDTFLTRARDEHWEFSSLRRAKYSTICFCHALHNQEKNEGLSYTCNNCQGTAIWHCNSCEDFDLCNKCYESMSHPHKLERVNSFVEVGGEDKQNATNSRNESIQRCIQSLVHACQCRDANCRRLSCHKMKRVVQHTKFCKKRQSANCPVCKQLIALCCYHAKHCNGASCQVPFCLNIRQKLQEQRRSQNRRADMMMRRRMDILTSGYGSSNTPGSQSTSTSSVVPSQSVSNPNPAQMTSYQGSGMSTAHMQHMPMPNQQQMTHVQQMQSHQFQAQGKGGGVQQNATPMHMLGVATTMHQNHPMMQLQQQQAHQPNVRMNMQIGGIHRTQSPIVGHMQQQAMNPPPYGRGTLPQNAYNMQAGASGPSAVYASGATQSMMIVGNQGIQSNAQVQQPVMQQGVQNLRSKVYSGQPIDRSALQHDPQVQAIVNRLKNAERSEEKEQVFNDLKKMPHLFAAFIKMKNNERSGSEVQQNISQLNAMQQHQQQQQQGMMRQSQIVTQQSGQWQQSATTQQYYQQQQQQQSGTTSQSVQQQPRGPGGQYASISQSQWQQQFQRGHQQPVSPAMQTQFNQVRSPTIGRSPSVSNMAPSPMVQPGNAQQMQQSQQQPGPGVNQDQQSYR